MALLARRGHAAPQSGDRHERTLPNRTTAVEATDEGQGGALLGLIVP
jgi:hypothetical protein